MQLLHTIEEAHKIFNTSGSNPLLVTCEDLRDWVCKYDRFPQYLFNELLAAKFAKIWEINVPEIAFIKVKPEHIPSDKFPSLQLPWFEKECFGSLHLENSKEVDHTMLSLFQDRSFTAKLANRADFLKIALFDIWMANEDRNHNNFNLLVYFSPERLNFFYAIDHVNIFNSSFLDYGIEPLTEDDSIVKTELAKVLFGNYRKLPQLVDSLVENFYLCTQECQDNINEILDLVPTSWSIDRGQAEARITQHLFLHEWKSTCEATFREFIQSFIIH